MNDETGLRRDRRDLVGSLFPAGRIGFLDRLNANADFVRVRRAFHGKPIFPHRLELHQRLAALVGSSPLDYLEFGVWKGETLRLWATAHGSPESRFFGFDTFEGLPEDWANVPRGTFALDGGAPKFEDPRTALVVGLFQNTLYSFLDRYTRGPRIVMHVDCDLYSSSLFVLAAMDRVLKDGDILIFDDFYSLDHEFQALMDYRRAFYRTLEPIAAVRSCAQAAFRIAGDSRTPQASSP